MKFLSTTQAAEVLGVNDSRVRQLIRDGQLQAVQVGRAYLLDESVVKTFQRPPIGRPKKESAAAVANSATGGQSAVPAKPTKKAAKKGGKQ